MCIICIKKKGVRFPSVECVKTMCDNNSHGFSIAISRGKTPHIVKTLNKQKFIHIYKGLIKKYDYEDTTMFIHARIMTHGTKRIENCHGWKENGLIFAHNGVLSIANRDDMTDSETFFRDIFSPAYKVGGWDAAERTINAIIGTSKFVFMNNQGEIKHYGNYIEDDGLLFSNSTYRPYIAPRFPSYRQSYWWEDDNASRNAWNKSLQDSETANSYDWTNLF